MKIQQYLARFRALDTNVIDDLALRKRAKALQAKQGGFTLLELLVVIAILATIAGGLLVSYDGLDTKAEKGQATFNLAAIDKGVRTFKVVSGSYPNSLDNLVDAGGTTVIANIPSKLQGKIGALTLTQEMVDSLNEVGVTTVRSISNADNTANVAGNSIPNRVFDPATRGYGTDLTLAAGTVVTAIESGSTANNDVIQDFGGGTVADSSRLRDMAGLDDTLTHAVVALGLGNNSTIVSQSDLSGVNAANFSQAPTYTSVDKDEYGRFLLLYHVATDDDDSGTFEAGETFEKARFVGVVDTYGDWQDEEFAEFTGQKS